MRDLPGAPKQLLSSVSEQRHRQELRQMLLLRCENCLHGIGQPLPTNAAMLELL